MSEYVNDQSVEDIHLDTMIRLAFLREEDQAVRQLLSSPEQPVDQQTVARLDQCFEKVMQQELQALSARERAKKRSRVRKVFQRTVEIAACVVLVLALGVGITFSASAEARSFILHLLMELDEQENTAYFSMQPVAVSDVDVPDGWTGNYFPTDIPEGFTISFFSQLGNMLEWSGPDGMKITFSEYDQFWGLTAGTEGADLTIEEVNGSFAHVIEGEAYGIHSVTIVWQVDDLWFDILTIQMDKKTSLDLARSVRKIK